MLGLGECPDKTKLLHKSACEMNFNQSWSELTAVMIFCLPVALPIFLFIQSTNALIIFGSDEGHSWKISMTELVDGARNV